MKWTMSITAFAAGVLLFVVVSKPPPAEAGSRISIGVTETIETYNPYGDSVALMYAMGCQIYGCLGTYDFEKGEWVGQLAERWEVKDPNTWLFYLRKDVRWSDGSPVTAEDVVHSINRVKTDPQSKQKQNVRPIIEVKALDKYTVKMTTKQPTAPLLAYIFRLLIITNKAVYDKYGPKVADRKYALSAAPYKLKELVLGERVVISKNLDYPGMKEKKQAPDEVVFRIMRETEQRVTALLNDEIQIAQFIPPHLAKRVQKHPKTKLIASDSVEIMFLAMQPKPPFDKKEVRQAVAYAIDRDKIIKTLLQGQASRLDGPIGPGQYGYNPNLKPKYTYNPEKAKQLLAQAGYPKGVDVELSTPVGRYTLDKQIMEAVTAMLSEVGIRTKLLTPEWPTLWARVQRGRVPFFYMGRGGVIDPSAPLQQYFETGGSLRIGFSNSEVDRLLALERQTFDPAKRKKYLSQAMSAITEQAPAHFMWRHKMLTGVSKRIEYKPRADSYIYAEDIRVLR